jgi:hypothetical protein|tara:strand:+ start:2038 stop:2199 length:162 start_codon:yes stop_codon:yes gene_type:complete
MKMNEFLFPFYPLFSPSSLINRYDFFFVFCVAVFVAVKVDDGSTKEEDKEDDV